MRLCLNMIVRNESAILERCLRSVLPHLHYYVVCDTGSTDDTVDLVRRVAGEAGVPGEIHAFGFENFEQARNRALELCRASKAEFDYVLLLDADMELVVEDPRWRERLEHPAYLVRQVSGGFAYHNVRLVARDTPARYVGVTHEYLELGAPAGRLDTVHMLDHACGSSRSVKWERDLALLSADLERRPDDARTVFYLAQTLRESGRLAEAIAAYERRVALGGWEEEAWYSLYMVARCHQALGDVPRFIAACLEAYNLRPTRAEPLHALAEHYRQAGQHEACAMVCEAGLRIPLPGDLLFVEEDVYRTGFRHQLSISGYYSRDPARREAARACCAALAVDREASAGIRDMARANWRFYARKSEELLGPVRFQPLDVPLAGGYHPCNPSLVVRNGVLWSSVRGVNYVVDRDRYQVEGGGPIRSQNLLVRLDGELRAREAVPLADEAPDRVEGAGIVGLEDIRLFEVAGALRGSCTVADRDPAWQRRMAVFDLGEDGRVERLTLQEHEADLPQKNWVPFVDEAGLGFVYWTDPTVVLRWDEEERQARPWLRQPCALALDHQRGGSGAVRFDDGWLYLAHEVGWLAGQRTYLHRFVHLDREFRVRAATEPFYFRSLGVEFCCGLAAGPAEGLEDGQLLASFGVNDGEAWLAVFQADRVRRALHP